MPSDSSSLSADDKEDDFKVLYDDQLCRLVDLAITLKIPCSSVTAHVQSCFCTKTQTPHRNPILYNSTYGGFGFSKSFLHFLGKDRYFEDRSCHPSILAYGNFLIKECAKICKYQDYYRSSSGNSSSDSEDDYDTLDHRTWKKRQDSKIIAQIDKYKSLRLENLPSIFAMNYEDDPGRCEEERIGLEWASDAYCHLDVEWITSLIEYQIHDHDGLETVVSP